MLSADNRFRKLVDFMDNNTEIGVCGSLVADNLQELKKFARADVPVTPHEEVVAQMLLQNPLKRGSMIIRSSILQQKGYRLNDKYPQMEDYDLWYRMRNESKFAVINEPLVYNSNHFNGHKSHEKRERSEALSFYLDKLLEFGIRPSDRELKIHLDLSDISKINKLSNPLAYKEWIARLKQQNQKVKF
ncbi:MAG: hypothetical protein ACXWDO_00750, partial [Bacteroidia bacterium]